MSDAADKAVSPGMTAGRLLREARQAQGLHIAALASAIKVTPRKLELLEADRFDELPDATFTRALAQTVCRSLKVDAAPVMALLPRRTGGRLGEVGEGLNSPFREHPGRPAPSDLSGLARPAIWGPVLVLLAAAAVYLMPHRWLEAAPPQSRPAPEPAASSAGVAAPVASAPAEAVPKIAETVAVSVLSAEPAAAASAALPGASHAAGIETTVSTLSTPTGATPGLLQLRVSAPSWVEVIDASGHALLSRLVEPAESVDLDGALPLKLKIGNASATEVNFRGQALELAPFTRGNVARLELK